MRVVRSSLRPARRSLKRCLVESRPSLPLWHLGADPEPEPDPARLDGLADKQHVRRSLFLLKRWPNEQEAMRLFREAIRSPSTSENLATAAKTVQALCDQPACLKAPLVPLYLLGQAASKHLPLQPAQVRALLDQTLKIWPVVSEYRSYFRMLAQHLATFEDLLALQLVERPAHLADFLRLNTPLLLQHLASPLLESQVQALRSVLKLDAQKTVPRELLGRLVAHLQHRSGFLDLADLEGLADAFLLAQKEDPRSPLLGPLLALLETLGQKLQARPNQPAQADFIAALHLANKLDSLPGFLQALLPPLLRGPAFAQVPQPDGSGFAGIFKVVQLDLKLDPLDSLNPKAKPVFVRALANHIQNLGLGWYKSAAPVLQTAFWLESRLGLRSLLDSKDAKAEMLNLLQSSESPWISSRAGHFNCRQLTQAVLDSLKTQSVLCLAEAASAARQQAPN